jgi:putative membrane protein
MVIVSKILIAILALEHFYFLYLEMFLWTTARGRKAFGTTEEFALASKVLAANQGLYNGFLGAGLVWVLLAPAELAKPLAFFFAGCVLVAGLYGGATANKRIYILQALPAALTLIAVLLLGVG